MEQYNVTGMSCAACSTRVEKAVSKVPGVTSCSVSLLTNSMGIEGTASPESIIKAVEDAGYGASKKGAAQNSISPNAAAEDALKDRETPKLKKRLIASVGFLAVLMYISMGHMMGAPLPAFLVGHENAISFAFTQLLLTLPILYINDKYYKNGFRSLLHGGPNMDSLIAVGSIAAVIYGVFAIYQIGYGLGHGDMARVEQYHMDLYFESAGMILTLITLGKFLETRSKGKTSQAISRLMDLAPKTATVLRDGAEAEIPVEEVRVGDRVAVRPGQSIPVDAAVLVSTPQELVGMIVEKAVNMAAMMKKNVVGLVENMSYYVCPDCGAKHEIFGASRADGLAALHGIPNVAKLPIDPRLAACSDGGLMEVFSGDWLDGMADAVEKL